MPTKFYGTPMSSYRRLKIEGGALFFTVALSDRGSDLLVRHVERLRRAYAEVEKRCPFETVAICILPDHIHALWRLPDGDADYASRWSRDASENETNGLRRLAARIIVGWAERSEAHAAFFTLQKVGSPDLVARNPGYAVYQNAWARRFAPLPTLQYSAGGRGHLTSRSDKAPRP